MNQPIENTAIKSKFTWRWVVIIALVPALGMAGWMTWQDWQVNPGGLFRGDEGTHWSVVLETAFSWFWPVALIAGVPAWVGLALARRWQAD